MPEQGHSSQWRFTFSIMLPVLITVIATFGLVCGLIYWSTSKSDQQALDRQVGLVSHLLDQQQEQLTREQSEVTAWDDAMRAIGDRVDLQWISSNLGLGLNETFGHDRSFVLDQDLKPIYAMQEGTSRDPQRFYELADVLMPMAQRLHQKDSILALSRYTTGASEELPSVADVMMIDGQPAYVSAMPIASNRPEFRARFNNPFIHITIQDIDPELAAVLGKLLVLNGARFDNDLTKIADFETSLPIFNKAGKMISQFVWSPERPGTEVIRQTTPAIIAAMVVVAVLITILMNQLRRSAAQLEAGRTAAQHLAFHDKLTGLANRALFEDRLNLAMALSRRGADQVALLFLDLDRFKQVNDTLGHEAGDQLIIQVAQRLRPLLRETDTISRLGGDEFAIIQPGVKSVADVVLTSDRIISALRQPFEVANSKAFVGVSIGIAMAPEMATNGIELTRKADIALYEAKAGGRDQHKIFEDRMSEAVQRRQTIEADLRNALNTGEGLDVEYLPLVRENGTVLVGVEASIVWHHPELGDVPTSRFIPVAETCGLIELVGEFLMRRACETGASAPGQRMAVRVFGAQLRNPLFYSKVFDLLHETGMKPKDLELEINEAMLTDADPITANALRKFRTAGINIVLGDFGTGFTSLRLLQHFEVDRIKIDRSFIAQLAESPDPEAITHAVVWLARAIGVEVSADGVDTLEQKKFLARMGCMSFQGALFSPGGQANWLREAARDERDEPRTAPQDDIQLWDIA